MASYADEILRGTDDPLFCTTIWHPLHAVQELAERLEAAIETDNEGHPSYPTGKLKPALTVPQTIPKLLARPHFPAGIRQIVQDEAVRMYSFKIDYLLIEAVEDALF